VNEYFAARDPTAAGLDRWLQIGSAEGPLLPTACANPAMLLAEQLQP
jgi:hypothetical protein